MKYFMTVLLLTFLYLNGASQVSDEIEIRQIRTLESMRNIKQKNAEIARRHQSIERFIAEKQVEKIGRNVTIPLVFNVLYAKGEERVSMARILSQIEALNRDFACEEKQEKALGIDRLEGFTEKATDTQIRFCLARLNSSGVKDQSAVRYFEVSKKDWSFDDRIKQRQHGGIPALEPESYINIWVARLVDTVSGYAQMPGGQSLTDGIVIDDRLFGTIGLKPPYNEGKTLTHLMGNYLGLYPLWGEAHCQDDYVEDTPIHNYMNSTCPDEKHISTWSGYPVEMTVNFMDNTPDACLYMFTEGQKWRMQAILSSEGPRGGLVESETECKSRLRSDEEQLAFLDQISIFPNPVKDLLGIEINTAQTGELIVQIFSNSGKLIYENNSTTEQGAAQLKVDCSTWPEGVYIIRAKIGDKYWNRKVSVSH